MSSSRLYVIGNGFDLWHGIPSRYAEFKVYVRKHDRALLRAVEEYLPVGEEWAELESALGHMDVDSIVDNLGHFMASYGADDWSDAGHHNFQYEVDKVVRLLSSRLYELFAAWVRQLPIPTQQSARNRLQTLDPNALFLSFNYTPTLRVLYGVPTNRTLFIHGCAELGDDDLVLGHAWNPNSRPSLNDRPDIAEIDTRLMEAHGILDEYFSKTFKPSAQLIGANRSFFDRLQQVSEVVVLGHSLADVDALYFRALFAQPAVAQSLWRVACLSVDEWPEKLQRLQNLGPFCERVNFALPVLWDSL